MSRLIIHAGMPKAGSSTIQRWLKLCVEDLDKFHGIRVRRIEVDAGEGALRLADASSTTDLNSGQFIEAYARSSMSLRAALLDGLFSHLSNDLRAYEVIILSSEAFAQPFWKNDRMFLDLLDRLTQAHSVVVGYYVRPQDSALEAAWRQWGFRTGLLPSEYLKHRSIQMHYHKTAEFMLEAYPTINFIVRPFRQDLLTGGDILRDFVNEVLGRPDLSVGDPIWSNPGLPLEIVNVLQRVPPGLLWRSPHDNHALHVIKQLAAELNITDSPEIVRSRETLRRYCWELFEPENRLLTQRLSWNCDNFVEPPSAEAWDGVTDPLLLVDELWQPRASEGELAFLFNALARIMEGVET